MSRSAGREDYGPASAGVRNKVSVLVRNIPLSYTAEDLRAKFEKFGELRDVYIPRDYYTQRSRGFGFIEFRDARDADEAIYQTDRTVLDGREINVCLSQEGRKTPREMMIMETKQGRSAGYGGSDSDRRDRRRSRSPRRGSRYSRSRSPRGRGGRGSRSRSPRGRGGRDYESDRDYDRDYHRGYERGRDRDRDRNYDCDYDRDYNRDGRGGNGSDRDRERGYDRGQEPERDNMKPSRSRSRSLQGEPECSPRERDVPSRGVFEELPHTDDAAQPMDDYN